MNNYNFILNLDTNLLNIFYSSNINTLLKKSKTQSQPSSTVLSQPLNIDDDDDDNWVSQVNSPHLR